ncbi:hypothetical protein [uncultured Mucilaginibacter sp.]|uniref:hypothetical protein n=1 Tax=uncultured Mucilaginibacter sp. TaxID=797541 RepID=UPI0025D5E2C6|nr:hypothetical protein [uncultured Mucilaginibacter sp.]
MNEFNDDELCLGKAISKSKLTMPDNNFEQRVLVRMGQQAEYKKNVKYIRYSMLCFAFFLVAGVAASYCLPGYLALLSGISAELLKLIFLAVFVFCLLIGTDYYIKYFQAKEAQAN